MVTIAAPCAHSDNRSTTVIYCSGYPITLYHALHLLLTFPSHHPSPHTLPPPSSSSAVQRCCFSLNSPLHPSLPLPFSERPWEGWGTSCCAVHGPGEGHQAHRPDRLHQVCPHPHVWDGDEGQSQLVNFFQEVQVLECTKVKSLRGRSSKKVKCGTFLQRDCGRNLRHKCGYPQRFLR